MSKSSFDLQTITYRSNSGAVRRDNSNEVEVTHPNIGGVQVDEWNNVYLLVPPLPPSRLDGCGIIEINYAFEVCVTQFFFFLFFFSVLNCSRSLAINFSKHADRWPLIIVCSYFKRVFPFSSSSFYHILPPLAAFTLVYSRDHTKEVEHSIL